MIKTKGDQLKFSLAFALMRLNIRVRKSSSPKLSEEDRFAVAEKAIKNLRGYGNAYDWLDEPVGPSPVGHGPSTYKPPD